MKTFKKALKIILISVASLFVVLLVLGWILEDKITEIAVERAGETIGAPMGMDDVKFSLITEFPHATIQFDGLWIGKNKEDSTSTQPIDTLVKLGKLRFGVKTLPLLSNVFKVREIKVEDGYARYFVDENGASNFDFLMATDTTEVVEEDTTATSPMPSVTLNELSLKNLTCYYKDDQQVMGVKLHIPEVKITADLDSTSMQATAVGQVTLNTGHVEGTNLNRLKDGQFLFDVAYANDSVTINDFTSKVDDAIVSCSGKVFPGDDLFLDMLVKASVPDVAAMSKYAPDDILDEYQVGQLAGGLNFDTRVKGLMAEDRLPHYEANFSMTDGTVRAMGYPLVYGINLRGSATNGEQNSNATTSVSLDNLSLSMSGNSVAVSGKFENLDRIKYDLTTHLDLDLDASKELIPDTLVQNPTGKIQLNLKTQGTAPDSVTDQFIQTAMKNTEVGIRMSDVGFGMDTLSIKGLSGKVDYKKNAVSVNAFSVKVPEYDFTMKLDKVSVSSGRSLLDPASIKTTIGNYELAVAKSRIYGDASVSNFDHPSFKLNTNVNLDLTSLKKHVPKDQVKDMKGKFGLKLSTYGKLNPDKMEEQMQDVIFDNTKIEMFMNGITLDMADTLMNVSDLKGKITMANHEINIKALSGAFSGITFSVPQTTVKNPFNTAVRNQPGTLVVTGESQFGSIDYAMLGAFMGSESESTSAPSEPSEPQRWNMDVQGKIGIERFRYDEATLLEGISASYQFTDTVFEAKGKFAVDKVTYGKALITDVSGLYNVKDTIYIIDQLKAKAFDGTTQTSMKIIMGEPDMMEIDLQSQAENIDVRKMLRQMDNLYQDYLTWENVDGVVSTNGIFLKMTMFGDSIDYEGMRMKGDFTFKNGGIYEYPLIQDMAQYMKWMKGSLDSLKFNTITSDIFIFKNNIVIPKTHLESNAIDLSMIGKQSFGEDFEYHIGVRPFQVVATTDQKRAGREKREDKGKEADKGMTYVKSVGRAGKFTNSPMFNKDDREGMEKWIRVQERLHNLNFNSKWFTFETNVEP